MSHEMIFDEMAHEFMDGQFGSIRFFFHSSVWFHDFIPALLERFHVDGLHQIEGFAQWEQEIRELREDLWD